MSCLFCPATDGLTKEHVFPAFMGCKVFVPDCSCKTCQKTGSDFEGVFANMTQTSRQTFEIPNREGIVPDAPVKIEVEGLSLPARRKPSGDIEYRPVVMELAPSGGKKVTRAVFINDDESAERFVTRRRARGENITDYGDRVVPKDVIIEPVSSQTLEFAFREEARCTAAKCALVALAYQYGIEYARSPQFDNLRRAIMNAPDTLSVSIFANRDFKDACLRSPRHHSVIAYLSGGMRKAWAIVTFFGGLSYIVELASTFEEPESRKFSLFYDAESQRIFRPVVLCDEQDLIGRVLSPSTVFNDVNAVDEQWFTIVDEYCRSKGRKLFRVRK
jgi:hypothetical protein